MITSCMIILSGCQKEEKVSVIETNTPPAVDQVEEIKDIVYEGISFNVEAKMEGETMKGNFTIQNTGNKSLPFYIGDAKIVTYEVQDDSGITLVKGEVKEEERTSLQAKEKISYPFEVKIKDIESDIVTVRADLNLVNKEHETYTKKELKVESQVQIPVTFTYLPDKETTYVYVDPSHEQTQKERYAFFKNGSVQKNSELTGVSVYTEDKDGVYLIYNNPDEIELNAENVLGKVTYGEKQKILALPAEKGKKWSSGGNSYEILSTDQTLTTPAGTYNSVIEVKMMNSNEVRLYYAKGVGLIEVAVASEEGIDPVQVLQKTQ